MPEVLGASRASDRHRRLETGADHRPLWLDGLSGSAQDYPAPPPALAPRDADEAAPVRGEWSRKRRPAVTSAACARATVATSRQYSRTRLPNASQRALFLLNSGKIMWSRLA